MRAGLACNRRGCSLHPTPLCFLLAGRFFLFFAMRQLLLPPLYSTSRFCHAHTLLTSLAALRLSIPQRRRNPSSTFTAFSPCPSCRATSSPLFFVCSALRREFTIGACASDLEALQMFTGVCSACAAEERKVHGGAKTVRSMLRVE